MSRYNLLDEGRIRVIADSRGEVKEVSLLDLFENCQNYYGLAGEMEAQNFAVTRFLLAILQTVFSRFDSHGEAYDYFNMDEKYRQISEIEDDSLELENYRQELRKTWKNLWERGSFPPIVGNYLEKWRDRFFLFDDKYPFYQVTHDLISGDMINKKKATEINGKFIDRTISESNNKPSLFSGKYDRDSNKNILNEGELARWLLTFQGYCGTFDKTAFNIEKYKGSKGWIYDLGGIYLEGDNLFETLCLNLILGSLKDAHIESSQKPCWEFSPLDMMNKYLYIYPINNSPDNLAELYTNRARAIYIDPETDLRKPFSMEIAKLPEINHVEQVLEPMTLRSFNKSGPNKEKYTPKKHPQMQAMWRNFSLLSITDKEKNMRKPGIITHLVKINEDIGEKRVGFHAISLKDDGNATSRVPTDEIDDRLFMSDILVSDLAEDGWVKNINDMVSLTNKVINKTYGGFINKIKDIRNISPGKTKNKAKNNKSASSENSKNKDDDNKVTYSSDFVNREVEEVFFKVDQPFRDRISSIDSSSAKEDKIREWKKTLMDLVRESADDFVKNAGPRDYTGRIKDDRLENIATAYNSFSYWLKADLGEVKNGRK